jgi:hypothetical protein
VGLVDRAELELLAAALEVGGAVELLAGAVEDPVTGVLPESDDDGMPKEEWLKDTLMGIEVEALALCEPWGAG